jgi:hypothetical protein
MSLIKKSDVKNHLSARHGAHIHLCAPDSQLPATGSIAAKSGAFDSSVFAKDFIADHSSPGIAIVHRNPVMDSDLPAGARSL